MSALHGIRVVDFSRVLAGPGCTALLALLGAEVIRVGTASKSDYREPPGKPSVLSQAKYSCTINLKTTAGRALAQQLASTADIVIENFSAGVIDRLGLGFDTLSRLNPAVSMISISGFGRSGTEADMVAYGSLLQGFSGWCSLIPGVELKPASGGLGITPAWTDRVTALMAAIAAIAAVQTRRNTGTGVYVDLSMIGSLHALMTGAVSEWLDAGHGVACPPVPNSCYPADNHRSWLAVSCFSDDQWLRLGETMGATDWAHELRGVDVRRMRSAEIDERIRGWLSGRPAADSLARLRRAGVPAAAAQSVWDLVDRDPVIAERGYYTGGAGDSQPRQPYTLSLPWLTASGERGRVSPGSDLGADTDDVLTRILGLPRRQIDQIRAAGGLD